MGFYSADANTDPNYTPAQEPHNSADMARIIDQMAMNAMQGEGGPLSPAAQQAADSAAKAKADRDYDRSIRESFGPKTSGHNLPHYTTVETAKQHFVSSDALLEAQTLLNLPAHIENQKEREAFESNPANAGRVFIEPYMEGKPVYTGFTRREGVDGLGRAWNEDFRNENRDYLYSRKQYEPESGSEAKHRLSISYEPDMVSEASIGGYTGYPTEAHKVTLGMTLGGVEQVIFKGQARKFSNSMKLKL